jgi:hypothetical protein
MRFFGGRATIKVRVAGPRLPSELLRCFGNSGISKFLAGKMPINSIGWRDSAAIIRGQVRFSSGDSSD